MRKADIAMEMVVGGAALLALLASHSVSIPIGEFAKDIDAVCRKVGGSQPMTLMNTSVK